MGIKKSEQIKCKIFYERDIKRLMDVFFSTERELGHEETEVLYTIQFKDGTIDSSSDRLTIDRNRSIQSIVFSLTNKILYTSISVNLHVDIMRTRSRYEVEGNDQEWVKEKSTKIQKIIDDTPNQNRYLSNPILRTTISILLIIFIFSSIFFLFENDVSNPIGFLVMIVTLTWAYFWTGRLLGPPLGDLYPKVDFDTSISRENKKKKQRAFLKLIVILFLVPLFIKFIVERII